MSRRPDDDTNDTHEVASRTTEMTDVSDGYLRGFGCKAGMGNTVRPHRFFLFPLVFLDHESESRRRDDAMLKRPKCRFSQQAAEEVTYMTTAAGSAQATRLLSRSAGVR